jgi:hypothetical protein
LKNLFQAWLGDLKSQINDQVFTFRNKEWNAQLSSGSQFNFELVVQGVAPGDIISVTFNGQPVDIGSGVSSTLPGTTVNPTGSTPTTSAAPITSTIDGKYNYGGVLHASLLFYEAQRAGKLPADNRISWRGDSMLMDKGENGEDLTGGYFDAGDFVKFGFPMAAFTTLVAWGTIDYEDAYVKAGELEQVRQAIRWSTDYFIKVSFINLFFTLPKKKINHYIESIKFHNIISYLIEDKNIKNNYFFFHRSTNHI